MESFNANCQHCRRFRPYCHQVRVRETGKTMIICARCRGMHYKGKIAIIPREKT